MSTENPLGPTWDDDKPAAPRIEGVQVSPAAVQAAIMEGRFTHEWDCPTEQGWVKVVYDMFPTGTRMAINDRTQHPLLIEYFSVAHALRSYGGWDFKGGKMSEKLTFLEQLSDPQYAFFLEQYHRGKLVQIERFKELKDRLGKSSPDRS